MCPQPSAAELSRECLDNLSGISTYREPLYRNLAQHAVASKLPVGGQRNCDEHKEYFS
jgi:hypothetical protein